MARLFGTSGIRRKIDEIPPEFAIKLGAALGTYTEGDNVVVGRDTRSSGPMLEGNLAKGLTSAGKNVVKTGVVPTPTVGVGTKKHGTGVMITASHNPPEYNGFKLWNTEGSFKPEEEDALQKIFESQKFKKGTGRVLKEDFIEEHIKLILSKIPPVSDVKVLVDCAGGSGSTVTPLMLERLGCEVIAINTNKNGIFPHLLEPTEKNLQETCEIVRKHDVDIAFAHDGDADRTAAIGKDGKLIEWDSFLSVLAYGLDTVVTTVDASMRIEDVCKKVVRTPVGDVYVADGIRKNNADFGGEPSGTFIFPDVHIYPDGVTTAAKAVSLINEGRFYEILSDIKSYPMERVKIPVENERKEQIMSNLKKVVDAEYSDIDGMRVETEDGWVLLRPSGTEPYLRITAEGKTKKSLENLVDLGRKWFREAAEL